jgi:hypothetical protein
MADITRDSMFCFLQKYGDSWVKRELLLFWIMHPNTRFSRKAIGYSLTSNNLDVEGSLKIMVEEGLIDESVSNGVTLYSLTLNEERRRLILELANLGWNRWQYMLSGRTIVSTLADSSAIISQVKVASPVS